MALISTGESVAALATSVGRVAPKLHVLEEKYRYLALHVKLVASSLCTFKVCLEAIQLWNPATANAGRPTGQLELDLQLSLESSAVVIAVIERTLRDTDLIKPGVQDQPRFLRFDASFGEFSTSLAAQVNAFQMLLAIYQFRDVAERGERLLRSDTRTVLNVAADSTASLQLNESDIHDAAFILSEESSANFAVENELLNSPLYQRLHKGFYLKEMSPADERSRSGSARNTDPTLSQHPAGGDVTGNAVAEEQPAHRGNARQRSRDSDLVPVESLVSLVPDPPFLGVPFHGEGNVLSRGNGRNSYNTAYAHKARSGALVDLEHPNNKEIANDDTREEPVPRNEKDVGHIQDEQIPTSPSTNAIVNPSSTRTERVAFARQTNVDDAKGQVQAKNASDDTSVLLESSENNGAVASLHDVYSYRNKTRSNPQITGDRSSPEGSSTNSGIYEPTSSTGNDKPPQPRSEISHSHSDRDGDGDLQSIPRNPSGTVLASGSPELLSPSHLSTVVDIRTAPAFEGIIDGDQDARSDDITRGPNPQVAKPRLPTRTQLRQNATPPSSSGLSLHSPKVDQLGLASPHSFNCISSADDAESIVSSSASSVVSSSGLPNSDYISSQAQIILQRDVPSSRHPGPLPYAEGLQPDLGVARGLQGPKTAGFKSVGKDLRGTKKAKGYVPYKNSSRFPAMSRFSLIGKSGKLAKAKLINEAAAAGKLALLSQFLQESRKDVQTFVTLSDEIYARTPLMRAAAGGHISCMELLVMNGAEFGVMDQDGKIALLHAVKAGQLESTKWLAERFRIVTTSPGYPLVPGPLEIPDKHGFRALHLAAGQDSTDNSGRTPLFSSIHNQRYYAFKYLVDNGASLTVADADQEAPLIWAAKANAQKAVVYLLEKGVNRHTRDVNGDLAVHHAARRGHRSILEMLYLKLDDLEAKNKLGERPLHLAAGAGQERVVKALLRIGCQVNAFTEPPITNGYKRTLDQLASTPLHYACSGAYLNAAADLIQHGASVNSNQEDGTSPLMMACSKRNTQLASLLLESGANIDAAKSSTCMTALHISAQEGDLDTVKLLVHYGANLKAMTKGKTRHTPLELALTSQSHRKKNPAAEWLAKCQANPMAHRPRTAAIASSHSAGARSPRNVLNLLSGSNGRHAGSRGSGGLPIAATGGQFGSPEDLLPPHNSLTARYVADTKYRYR